MTTETTAAIPWYKSPVTRGALTSLFALLAVITPKLMTAIGLTSGDISQVVDNILIVGAAGSALYTVIERIRSPLQPITLTQTAADVHPATLVAVTVPVIPTPLEVKKL